MPGAREHGLFVRPIEHFVQRLGGAARAGGERALDVVVVGGGAAGVELAMALAAPAAASATARVGAGHRRRRAAGRLSAGACSGAPGARWQRSGVTLLEEAARRWPPTTCVLADGTRLACDAPVLAIGAAAPRLAGRQRPGAGRARLRRHRRPRCRACRTPRCLPPATWPRASTRRTRERRLCGARRPAAGAEPAPLRCGGGRCSRTRRSAHAEPAVLRRAPRHRRPGAAGRPKARWVWRWKDRIDRGFIARYTRAALRGRWAVKLITSTGGTRPSVSRGRSAVRSMARSTASSQSLLPLLLTRRRRGCVPLGEARTSTSAAGLPLTVSVKHDVGLDRARSAAGVAGRRRGVLQRRAGGAGCAGARRPGRACASGCPRAAWPGARSAFARCFSRCSCCSRLACASALPWRRPRPRARLLALGLLLLGLGLLVALGLLALGALALGLLLLLRAFSMAICASTAGGGAAVPRAAWAPVPAAAAAAAVAPAAVLHRRAARPPAARRPTARR